MSNNWRLRNLMKIFDLADFGTLGEKNKRESFMSLLSEILDYAILDASWVV